MQLPQLLQYGPTGPMDNDPYSINAGAPPGSSQPGWLDTIAGDLLSSVGLTITNMDDSVQTSVQITAGPTLDPTQKMATAWLSGGVAGTNYLCRWHLQTVAGRSDWKSVILPVVADRS